MSLFFIDNHSLLAFFLFDPLTVKKRKNSMLHNSILPRGQLYMLLPELIISPNLAIYVTVWAACVTVWAACITVRNDALVFFTVQALYSLARSHPTLCVEFYYD